eukprot:156296_1
MSSKMDIIMVTTYILLSIITSSQAVYQEGECNGIYYEENLKNWALDVCTNSTMFGTLTSAKYECIDNDIKHSYFYSNNKCSGDPDYQPRIDYDGNVCGASINCPYSIIRVYQSVSYCDDLSFWDDKAFLINICQLSVNGSEMLTCDQNTGLIRKSFSDETCTGEAIETDTLYPINQCIQSDDGYMVTFKSCNERSDTTA